MFKAPTTLKPKRQAKRRIQESSTPETPDRHGPLPLKQIQYRSYQHQILIYHYRAIYLSVDNLRTSFTRHQHGFVDALIGTDTLLATQFIPPGDEVPNNCIEVAYLTGVFPNRKTEHSGSALGFRTSINITDWFCFNQPIDDTILNSLVFNQFTHRIQSKQGVGPDNEWRLFNLVAYLPKGLEQRRVRGGNEEHRLWHESLWRTKRHPLKLTLMWKGFVKEMKEHNEAERVKAQQCKVAKDSEDEEEYEDVKVEEIDANDDMMDMS